MMSEINEEYKITIMNDAYLFDGHGKVHTWLKFYFSDGTSAPFTVAGRINGFTFDTVLFTRQDEVVRNFYLKFN